MHSVETHAQLAKMHPLGRIGEVSEIVGAILYLESASSVTGETIRVDGGQSAHHRTSYEGERYALRRQSAGRTAGIGPTAEIGRERMNVPSRRIALKNSDFAIDHNSRGRTQASTKITRGPS